MWQKSRQRFVKILKFTAKSWLNSHVRTWVWSPCGQRRALLFLYHLHFGPKITIRRATAMKARNVKLTNMMSRNKHMQELIAEWVSNKAREMCWEAHSLWFGHFHFRFRFPRRIFGEGKWREEEVNEGKGMEWCKGSERAGRVREGEGRTVKGRRRGREKRKGRGEGKGRHPPPWNPGSATVFFDYMWYT